MLDAQMKYQVTKENKNSQTSKCNECIEERDLDELDAGMVVKRTSKSDKDGVNRIHSVNSSDGLCRVCSV